MPYTPTKRLLNEKDAAKANLISQNLLKGEVNAHDCPWVEIGKLYVSVTITGEESWLPLLALLTSKGHKKFVVFTGRHGDIPNMVNNKTAETVGVFDPAHTEEDKKIKTIALKEFPGITVDLVDTSAGKKNQAKWLQTETTKHLKAGASVIYAWCYSLFTFVEGDADADKALVKKRGSQDPIKIVSNSRQQVEIEKSVGTLVKEGFAWVPRK